MKEQQINEWVKSLSYTIHVQSEDSWKIEIMERYKEPSKVTFQTCCAKQSFEHLQNKGLPPILAGFKCCQCNAESHKVLKGTRLILLKNGSFIFLFDFAEGFD
ncbi:hypothetical protein SAMN05444392_11649 [Seinonella peptonophila]|uniref:Uncharacterized protein n=1 Tax=Seinonella peptonophila TaxID=112248 RepID=A0A1M5AWX5_9BACL|nr:hypothetical protein [Seinonella peptonophila]SHF34725.1 hypothetical protein SAMN05444392_11649 [Seinonella peptonophila]